MPSASRDPTLLSPCLPRFVASVALVASGDLLPKPLTSQGRDPWAPPAAPPPAPPVPGTAGFSVPPSPSPRERSHDVLAVGEGLPAGRVEGEESRGEGPSPLEAPPPNRNADLCPPPVIPRERSDRGTSTPLVPHPTLPAGRLAGPPQAVRRAGPLVASGDFVSCPCRSGIPMLVRRPCGGPAASTWVAEPKSFRGGACPERSERMSLPPSKRLGAPRRAAVPVAGGDPRTHSPYRVR